MRSVMEHSFAQVPRANIPRSTFDRSHGVKTTFDADYLIPIYIDDVMPGDTFNLDMTFLARLTSPTVLPLMDNMHLSSFWFFIPYRLVWDNWTKFCGAQDDPADSIDFTIPAVFTNATYNMGAGNDFTDLANYFGIPPLASVDTTAISALPFRAFNLVWNEFFRDQNLQDSLTVNTDNGPDGGSTEYGLKKRGKRHDYFTSALPWPQKQTTGVALPMGTSAPVSHGAADGIAIGVYSTVNTGYKAMDSDAAAVDASTTASIESASLYADLDHANAVGATINDLRLSFQTQRLLERDARSGTRYNESILAHFGVTVPDFRVQRPEFLGGGSSPVHINPIAQTTYQGTQTVEDAKGALSGIGTATGTHGFTKSFTEHGLLLGLVNVQGDITYSQGIERYWTKTTRYEFYWPVLAQIGEQTVLNGEIYYQNTAADDNVFGYQERYAEYRYKPSRLTGLMAIDATANLDEFHLSEEFTTLPTLGDTFIQSNTAAPLDRAISVPSQPHFVFDAYIKLKCARPLPLWGVPGNLDHF